jgi:hypothetical protein
LGTIARLSTWISTPPKHVASSGIGATLSCAAIETTHQPIERLSDWEPGQELSWAEAYSGIREDCFPADGKRYEAFDLYCVDPDCDCGRVSVRFDELEPKEANMTDQAPADSPGPSPKPLGALHGPGRLNNPAASVFDSLPGRLPQLECSQPPEQRISILSPGPRANGAHAGVSPIVLVPALR